MSRIFDLLNIVYGMALDLAEREDSEKWRSIARRIYELANAVRA